jgi:hypothetical protein
MDDEHAAMKTGGALSGKDLPAVHILGDKTGGLASKGALTEGPWLSFFVPSWNVLPGSSVAEQVTVNHLVAGSIPARAAILEILRTHRGIRFATTSNACGRGLRLREGMENPD